MGHELDGESDLLYFGARYYDATLSRFLSTDPYIGNFRADFDPFRSQSLNPFSFVRDNPMIHLDSSGKATLAIIRNKVIATDPKDPHDYPIEDSGETGLTEKGIEEIKQTTREALRYNSRLRKAIDKTKATIEFARGDSINNKDG